MEGAEVLHIGLGKFSVWQYLLRFVASDIRKARVGISELEMRDSEGCKVHQPPLQSCTRIPELLCGYLCVAGFRGFWPF